MFVCKRITFASVSFHHEGGRFGVHNISLTQPLFIEVPGSSQEYELSHVCV
jgi:hypothetical protein